MIDVERIIRELEQQRAAIDSAIASLRQISGIPGLATTTTARVKRAVTKQSRGRRHISAEGRRRIAEAQRRRWAVQKGEDSGPATKKGARKKRGRKAAGKRAAKKIGGAAATA